MKARAARLIRLFLVLPMTLAGIAAAQTPGVPADALPTAATASAASGPTATLPASATSPASAAASGIAPSSTGPGTPQRYTFSWPLDSAEARPRGGSTRGAPVTLARDATPEWKSLRAAGLSTLERDRRAILAMAGTYRVGFDFLEVVSFADVEADARARAAADPATLAASQAKAQRARAPYQSWGTEKVYVDRNQSGFISLVHILEMRIVGRDGALSEPMVTKHWRQDWRHEPAAIVEYRGGDRWQRRALGESERRGAWLQTVYQVDESPRYASVGRWEHSASFSTWLSKDTWRPLPRREWSVRDDYQALIGTNRHTIGPTGWIQEENNLKAVLTAQRRLDPLRPYVGREYGVSRYERLADADFAMADRYYGRTRQFWDDVKAEWANAFAQQKTVTLRGPVDKLGLFMPLFERAEQVEARAGADASQGRSAAPSSTPEDIAEIRRVLADMGALAR